MKKNRCSLCGGKLQNGRCVECGLDNTQNDKTYRINVSSCDGEPLTHVHSDESQFQTTYRMPEQQQTAQQQRTSWSQQTAQQQRTTQTNGNAKALRQKKRSSGGRKVAKITTWIVILSVIGSIAGTVIELFSDIRDSYDYGYDESYDPYEYVDVELPADGDYFEVTLGPGKYYVGEQIPAGYYTAYLESEWGSFSLYDPENGIYISEYMGEDAEYNQDQPYEDLRLFDGAELTVYFGMQLGLETENAQTGTMTGQPNPLTESLDLAGTATAGVDFPAGMYDLSVSETSQEGYGDVEILVPGTLTQEDIDEYGCKTEYLTLDRDRAEGGTYKNLALPEGTVLEISGITLHLTPSEVIGTRDYIDYYELIEE